MTDHTLGASASASASESASATGPAPAVVSPDAGTTPAPPTARRGRLTDRGSRAIDVAVATLAAVLVTVVHSIHYVLSTPYWLDESWVLIAVRGPLHDVRLTTSSTPVLWTMLLRLDFLGQDQRLRLIPLAFAGLAAAAGYALLRALELPRVVAFVLGAGAVLFAPSMLIRNDLKQYTADAFVVMLLLVLVARIDGQWTRRRLLELGAVCAFAPGISSAAVFTASAALASCAVLIVIRRQWGWTRDLAMAAGIAVVGYALWIGAFALPNDTSSLKNYWDDYYPSLHGLWGYLRLREHSMLVSVGIVSVVGVAVLNVLGLATLIRRGRIATAVLLPIAFVGNMIAGLMHLSPFLDERTSTWLLTGDDVLMAIGVVGVGSWLVHRDARRGRPAAAVLAVAAALAFIVPHGDLIYRHTINVDDVAAVTGYVDSHKGPHDVVVLDFGASYSYSYYSGHRAIPARSSIPANGFVVRYPTADRVVVIAPQGVTRVATAMAQAAALTAPYPGAQIWVIRYEIDTTEQLQWNTVTPVYGLHVDQGYAPPLLVSTPSNSGTTAAL